MLPKKKKQDQDERRAHRRVKKHFLLRYFTVEKPEEKIDLTQMKNISHGGMCFITAQEFPVGTKMGVELNTPFLTDVTHLTGIVRGSVEKTRDLIYETRLEFDDLNADAQFVLNKLMEFFNNSDNPHD